MKNYHTVESRESRAEGKASVALAFTLIELLVVISIIAVLAAFSVPVIGSIKKREYINKTQAEMAQLETAIESYKSTYGFYPPGNTNTVIPVGKDIVNPSIPINPLYYELLGITNDGVNYNVLGGGGQPIAVSDMESQQVFDSIGGFMNCNSTNNISREDSRTARSFLQDLRQNQSGIVTNSHNIAITVLTASIGAPDGDYPLGKTDLNPWRYVSPGINNPSGYDLWVKLQLKPGQTILVCNWTKQIQINSPLP